MKDIVEAYFENIKEKLIQEIEKSEFIIYAAVAWVTDGDILSALMKKIHHSKFLAPCSVFNLKQKKISSVF